jgi:DNA polymerase-3 subunit gamma/tau
MSDSLHTLYRPQDWDQIIGQDPIVKSMAPLIEARNTHCFLLVGPFGVGKTSLARIAAAKLGALPSDIREVNASKFTGIDDMRDLTENIRLMPLGGRPVIFILDECHSLSRNSWNLLLKDTEEPPPWLYWFFCTTEVGKVPQGIITRSVRYDLRSIPWEDLLDQIVRPVAELEGIECGDDILGMVARAAEGSPRQALVFLAACRNTTDPKEAAALLQRVSESKDDAAFKLAQQLMKGGNWDTFKPLLEALKEENVEGVRRIIVSYATTSILNAKTDKVAGRSAAILEMFSAPFNANEGITPLVTGVARLVLLS